MRQASADQMSSIADKAVGEDVLDFKFSGELAPWWRRPVENRKKSKICMDQRKNPADDQRRQPAVRVAGMLKCLLHPQKLNPCPNEH